MARARFRPPQPLEGYQGGLKATALTYSGMQLKILITAPLRQLMFFLPIYNNTKPVLLAHDLVFAIRVLLQTK